MSELIERLRDPVTYDDTAHTAELAIARIEHLERALAQAREAFDSAVNSARLLGATQAKQGFGAYTELDARFETAMHQSIATHRRTLAAIDEALKS